MSAVERLYNEYLCVYSEDENSRFYDCEMSQVKEMLIECLESESMTSNCIDAIYAILPRIDDDKLVEELEDELIRYDPYLKIETEE